MGCIDDSDDLLRLQEVLQQMIDAKPNDESHGAFGQWREPNLTRQEFNGALEQLNFFLSDRAICDRLFTMLDKTGDEVINATEFLIVASTLLKQKLADHLQTAMQFVALNQTQLDEKQLRFVLTTLTNAVSFFGDSVMPKKAVTAIVKEMFDGHPAPIPLKELAPRLETHPILLDYIHKRPNEILAQTQSVSFA